MVGVPDRPWPRETVPLETNINTYSNKYLIVKDFHDLYKYIKNSKAKNAYSKVISFNIKLENLKSSTY